MKPNTHFSFLPNNHVSQDIGNLTRLYLPIIEKDAVALYLYFLSFWDNGGRKHLFSQILNHLNIGMEDFQNSLDRLIAIRLVAVYKKEEQYFIRLYEPISAENFFSHHVYSKLLEKKIGDVAADSLKSSPINGQLVSRSFSEIFSVEDRELPSAQPKNDFELHYFKQQMARDHLRFANESDDLFALFAIAEQQKWTWYETYILARETAVSHVISTKRMKKKLAQKVTTEHFSPKEQSIIQAAKNKKPSAFLAEIKSVRQATITPTEQKTIQNIEKLGLLDEVINIVLLLTFNKVDSANLNEKYALKVANDFAYQQVNSAEEAVLKIRERNQNKHATKTSSTKKNNIPEWSQPDYKNDTSVEKQAELEQQKQKLLAKLDKGGD